jgi:hypothetical protein
MILKWFKSLNRKKVTIEEFRAKTEDWEGMENEIKELRKFKAIFCPVKNGIYGHIVHNNVLGIAIEDRINTLEKLQEKITI